MALPLKWMQCEADINRKYFVVTLSLLVSYISLIAHLKLYLKSKYLPVILLLVINCMWKTV